MLFYVDRVNLASQLRLAMCVLISRFSRNLAPIFSHCRGYSRSCQSRSLVARRGCIRASSEMNRLSTLLARSEVNNNGGGRTIQNWAKRTNLSRPFMDGSCRVEEKSSIATFRSDGQPPGIVCGVRVLILFARGRLSDKASWNRQFDMRNQAGRALILGERNTRRWRLASDERFSVCGVIMYFDSTLENIEPLNFCYMSN